MTTEQKEVMNAIEAMTRAFENKDIKGVMSSYESEATVVFEPGAPVSDMNQVREMFIGTFSINPKFVFSGHEVIVTGNMATHIAPWTMTGTGPDGSAIEQSGLSVGVLRKQENGQWLFVIDNPHGQMLLNN